MSDIEKKAVWCSNKGTYNKSIFLAMPTVFFVLDDTDKIWAYTHTADSHRSLQWLDILKKKLLKKKQSEIISSLSYIEECMKYDLVLASGFQPDGKSTLQVYEHSDFNYSLIIPEHNIAYHRIYKDEYNSFYSEESWLLKNKKLINQYSISSFAYIRLFADEINENLEHPDVYLISTLRSIDYVLDTIGSLNIVKSSIESDHL